MHKKIVFLAVTILAAIVLPPIAGGLAVTVGYLAGMEAEALVILFGSTAAGMFASVVALAGLTASLFFNS